MPHSGLMDELHMDPEEAALLRARLHLRGGRRRLRQGKTGAGLATVYDALLSGMRWSVLVHRRRGEAWAQKGLDLEAPRSLYPALVAAGILGGEGLELSNLEDLVDHALHREPISEADAMAWLGKIEGLMTRLGVLPFDEASLPPEDPRTF